VIIAVGELLANIYCYAAQATTLPLASFASSLIDSGRLRWGRSPCHKRKPLLSEAHGHWEFPVGARHRPVEEKKRLTHL